MSGDMTGPGDLPDRRRRATLAFGALLGGWLAACAVTWAMEGSGGGPRWADVFWFDMIIGGFALIAWLVTVLPLALFANHRNWFFNPLLAPVIGATCAVILLLLQFWLFFDTAPWQVLQERRFSEIYLLVLAAILGATLWTGYTWRIRVMRHR